MPNLEKRLKLSQKTESEIIPEILPDGAPASVDIVPPELVVDFMADSDENGEDQSNSDKGEKSGEFDNSKTDQMTKD